MTDELYLFAITALLPLTALMVVLQVNPYQALVMRGILGAIAALTYALFGAADVALTEALVGTMLSITLYAVAVRSSMEMRLGWVQTLSLPAEADPIPERLVSQSALAENASSQSANAEAQVAADPAAETCLETGLLFGPVPDELDGTLVAALRKILKSHHLRLEVLAYPNLEALQIALETKRIHTALLPPDSPFSGLQASNLPGQSESSQNDSSKDRPASNAEPAYRLQTRVKRLHDILSDGLPASVAEIGYLDLAQKPVAIAPPFPQPPAHSVQESP